MGCVKYTLIKYFKVNKHRPNGDRKMCSDSDTDWVGKKLPGTTQEDSSTLQSNMSSNHRIKIYQSLLK